MGRPTLSRAAPWAAATLLLVAAAIATVATEAVAWGGEDFAAAALLLYGACAGWEVARRRLPGRAGRCAAALAIAALVLLVWAQLAVGVLGS
ncbi:hypothetical protein, partial [Salinarimonas rosea]|uniref:hypothetical protein n=1 Tax=Salinarimonas rosea TaxID=552063 RepID=UPI0004267783